MGMLTLLHFSKRVWKNWVLRNIVCKNHYKHECTGVKLASRYRL